MLRSQFPEQRNNLGRTFPGTEYDFGVTRSL